MIIIKARYDTNCQGIYLPYTHIKYTININIMYNYIKYISYMEKITLLYLKYISNEYAESNYYNVYFIITITFLHLSFILNLE